GSGGDGGGADRTAREAGHGGARFQRGDGGAERGAGAGGDRGRDGDGALVELEGVSPAGICGGRAGRGGGGAFVGVHVQGDRGGGSRRGVAGGADRQAEHAAEHFAGG